MELTDPIPGVRTPRAALFDLDGTLVNSEPRGLAIWARFLESHGIDYDDETLREFMGRRGGDVLAERPELFPTLTPERLVTELRALADDPDLPPVECLAESVTFLHDLHAQGVAIGVVTSAGAEWVRLALRQAELAPLFRAIVTAGDVTAGKPHPEGYLLGAELLGHSPAEIVAFEDTPTGLEAARRAGMWCVGVTTTHEAPRLCDADRVVDRLTEVEWPWIVPVERFHLPW